MQKYILILLAIIAFSCNKNDDNNEDVNPEGQTILEVVTLDKNGNILPGTEVLIYYPDHLNETGTYKYLKYSDKNGIATFTGVRDISVIVSGYYSGCKFVEQAVTEELTDNTTNVFNLVLNNYSTLSVKNNSSNPYNIYIDNNFAFTMSGGSVSDTLLSAETHNFKAIQKSGYAFYPTEVDISKRLEVCDNYTWNIP